MSFGNVTADSTSRLQVNRVVCGLLRNTQILAFDRKETGRSTGKCMKITVELHDLIRMETLANSTSVL